VFIGSINPDTRFIVQSLIPEFENLPIFVGCSGNFTTERLLLKNGLTNITGNDVSLYSTAVGNFLTHRKINIGVKDEKYSWLEAYLTDGISQIATLLLCSEYFKFVDKDNQPYYKRQSGAYRTQFETLHKKTVTRLSERLKGMEIKDYVCGDVLEYVKTIPEQSAFLTFPPTYKGGYEKLYKKINEVFEWDEPQYEVFSKESMHVLKSEIKKKAKWLFLTDKKDESEEPFLIAELQPASNTKTIYLYSNMNGQKRITKPQRAYDPVPLERATGKLTGKLKLVSLTPSQLNTLRSEYLKRSIAYTGTPDVIIGILDDGKLLGVLAFRQISPIYRDMADLYMLTDFCIGPSIYKRLSKLVLCVALTTDVKEIVEAALQYPIRRIFTTIFTEKAVSMKYRGLFELFNRNDDKINYVADIGRWTLEEAFEFWKKKYGDC